MSIHELLGRIENMGGEVWVDSDLLKFKIPNQYCTAELMEQLKKSKFEIIHTIKERQPKPYLASNGDLVIPFDCDQKYHWWKPGSMKIKEIREELQKHWKN